MLKIAVISYLNSLPFVYGLKRSKLSKVINLDIGHPAFCADKLINDEVDLALVPVSIIPNLQAPYIISDYCIGANSEVDTVCLFSDVPISEIECVDLDYQSKTSVALLKILMSEYWRVTPRFRNAKLGFESRISGRNSALVIGDRAFDLRTKHKYIYDLAAIWKDMTGLPFVFAAWVSNKKLTEDFLIKFNQALKYGLASINDALDMEFQKYFNCKNPKAYLNNKISYTLDAKKIAGMNLFLNKI